MGCGSPGARLRRRLVRFTDGEHFGFAKDSSGGFMPGVKITLSSITTNVRFTTETDSSGVYQFPQLPPATYFADRRSERIQEGQHR